MPESPLAAAIDHLRAVPLEEFVAERTRLARDLRAGGNRSEAAELAKLPKPSAADWALTRVAREEPGVVRDWLAAAAALREASTHAGDVGGDAVRAAMSGHRAATDRLLEVVADRARPGGRPLSGAMLDRVRGLLGAATADDDAAGLFAAGWVTAGAEATARSREPTAEESPPIPSRPSAADRKAEARAKKRVELERHARTAEESAERLRLAADRCETEAQSAEERLEETRRALRRSESEAGAARGAATDAEQAATTAERELRRIRGALRRAGG